MELYVYLPSYLFGHLLFLPQLVLAVGWCRQEIYILLQLLKKCFGLIEISANEENIINILRITCLGTILLLYDNVYISRQNQMEVNSITQTKADETLLSYHQKFPPIPQLHSILLDSSILPFSCSFHLLRLPSYSLAVL